MMICQRLQAENAGLTPTPNPEQPAPEVAAQAPPAHT